MLIDLMIQYINVNNLFTAIFFSMAYIMTLIEQTNLYLDTTFVKSPSKWKHFANI